MKTIKGILFISALCFVTSSNGQFLKRLTKKAEEAAKRTVEQKVQEKTARETEKTFDTLFNSNGGVFKNEKTEKLDSYAFSHQYIMQMISENDTTDITYYLTNEHEYMGSSFTAGKDQKFITVMDLPNTAIHTFMDMGGQKTMNSMKFDLDEVSDAKLNNERFSIAATGQHKKILGYECKEFQVTGPQLSGTVWVTQDAGISVQKAFSELKTKRIKGSTGMDQSWVSSVDGLALEMKMIDYSQKNPKPIKMICTHLSESAFSINTKEYEKP